MRAVVAGVFFSLVASLAMGQGLGDLARREKERREKNQSQGTRARVLTLEEKSSPPEGAEDGGEGADEAGPTPLTELAGTHDPADLPIPGSGPVAGSVPAPSPVAPAFTLPDRNGRRVSLGDFRGKPVLIDFWATWCAPCRGTMPAVQNLHQRYAGELQVLAINIEGHTEEVKSYLDEARYSFLVLFDEGNWQAPVLKSYGVSSIPHTFLIDREGVILFSGHPNGLDEEKIRRALRE